MATELWQWVPMLVPFEALPRVVGELCGAPLRAPESNDVTKFAPTTNPGLVRNVARRWSGEGVTLTITEQVHAYSERGEAPHEESSWDARVDWQSPSASLFLDGSRWGRHWLSPALGTCVYRFSGDAAASEVLERRWLEIIDRDFFKPTWPEHPLVPAAFRTPLKGLALASKEHQATRSEIGRQAHYPALFWTNTDPAWGVIVSGNQALPIGPLPKEPHTFVIYLERPSGSPRRDVLEIFEAMIDDAKVSPVAAESGIANGALGLASLSSMSDRVKYASWRGAGWILRSQLGFQSAPARTSRHGAFDFEWAIQSERGSFALFARQTQSRDRDQESLSLCVVARWPRWTFLRHMRRVFAADGWTWQKLHPSSFWW